MEGTKNDGTFGALFNKGASLLANKGMVASAKATAKAAARGAKAVAKTNLKQKLLQKQILKEEQRLRKI